MNIKTFIDRWLNARSNRTLSSLSRATEVPLSTIRRLYNGEGGLPDSKSTLPVLAAVCSLDEMSSYVQANYPEVAKFYESLAMSLDKDAAPQVLDNSIFDTREAYFTFALACANLATRYRIHKLFGNFGLQTADELVAIGILGKRGDSYITFDGLKSVYQNRHYINVQSSKHITSVVNPLANNDLIKSIVMVVDTEGRKQIEELSRRYIEDILTVAHREVSTDKHVIALSVVYSRVVDSEDETGSAPLEA